MKNCLKCAKFVEKDWYGLHEDCFLEWFSLKELCSFENIASHRYSADKPPNSSFFHGKFRKYSSTLGGQKYLLKLEESDYKELPATEYLCKRYLELCS